MADVTEAIRDFLLDLEGESQFELTFSYNGTDYRTVFNANKETMGEQENMYVIVVDNGCVEVTVTYMTEGEGNDEVTTPEVDSKIHAEDRTTKGWLTSSTNGKKACFEPVLVTNARGTVRNSGKRTTSGDVLQILKTKLVRAFPWMEDEPLKLFDGAHDVSEAGAGTFISPFHIVRGGNAYYEKYGYRSHVIAGLKLALQGLTWSGCTDPMKAIILDCSGKKDEDYPPGQLLTTLMKEISWEDELAYNTTHPRSLSQTVLKEFALSRFPRGADLQTFTLDTDSDDWIRCDAELVLTEFSEEVAVAAAVAVAAPVAAAVPVKAAGGAGVGRRHTRRARRNKRRGTRRNKRRSTRRR